ncbi:hypothetical protein F5Y11DRAFT_341000 [Daldinia sp. FL1419]|nr:hypothetical protein F5Y11DRAFT_341000 [Daldinia sp. FL1419]
MQGDIFQLEQMAAAQAAAAHMELNPVPQDTKTDPQVAIYNEDDLSHLLYVNHLHHDGHKGRVIVNHVYRDGYTTPLESGTQTPESETNETPILSDCESDFDEGVYSSSSSLDPYTRTSPLRFEDGFEFPVFLGRQAEETTHVAEPVVSERAKQVCIATPEERHVSTISGPLMSWWPALEDLMEHEWIEEETVERKTSKETSQRQHVSDIEGSLMSWWPLPVELLEHEWDERFYE